MKTDRNGAWILLAFVLVCAFAICAKGAERVIEVDGRGYLIVQVPRSGDVMDRYRVAPGRSKDTSDVAVSRIPVDRPLSLLDIIARFRCTGKECESAEGLVRRALEMELAAKEQK